MVRTRGVAALAGIAAGCAMIAVCGGSDPTGTGTNVERVYADHREIDIEFPSGGTSLSGTLYLPLGEGPFRTVVINQGSSWTTRVTWEEVAPLVAFFGGAFSADKRGEGRSGGQCCPADLAAEFALAAADAIAAVDAVRRITRVDPARVGLWGSSYSGWTVPIAATLGGAMVAFNIITVGGAVSVGQVQLYHQLTGYDTCAPGGLTDAEVTAMLDAAGVSVFDPTPSLEALAQPTLWVFGGRDLSTPTTLAVRNLEDVRSRIPKPWLIRVFPNANHELIENGTICQAEGTLADVAGAITEFVAMLP